LLLYNKTLAFLFLVASEEGHQHHLIDQTDDKHQHHHHHHGKESHGDHGMNGLQN